MTSSSSNRRRKGNEPMEVDDSEFDPFRFKSPFHQKFYQTHVNQRAIIPETHFQLEEEEFPEIQQQIELRGWKRLAKPKKKVELALVREFYANARMNPSNPKSYTQFQTFIRSIKVNFDMESIKAVLRTRELKSDTHYRRRMTPAHQDLDTVIADLCVQGATWELGATNAPLFLKRRDLNQTARGWHEFVIHNIMPTTNSSEVTVKRAVLIHCIMLGQEVKVERLIEEGMFDIISNLHSTKPPLAFPNIVARLCEAPGIRSGNGKRVPKARPITSAVMRNIRHQQRQISQPQPHRQPLYEGGQEQHQPGYGWETMQQDMASFRLNQTEFFENIQAQQTAFGQSLNELKVMHHDMVHKQHEFFKDVKTMQELQQEVIRGLQDLYGELISNDVQLQKEFINQRKNFSSHMSKIYKTLEEQNKEIANLNALVMHQSVNIEGQQLYTNWALQQLMPSLTPMPPEDIVERMRQNTLHSKPMFDGMLRPWPVGGTSTAAEASRSTPPKERKEVRGPQEGSDEDD